MKLTPLWHYKISRFIAWLPKIPVLGKVLAPMVQLAHLGIVYNQIIEEGKTEWQKQKSAKTAIKKLE